MAQNCSSLLGDDSGGEAPSLGSWNPSSGAKMQRPEKCDTGTTRWLLCFFLDVIFFFLFFLFLFFELLFCWGCSLEWFWFGSCLQISRMDDGTWVLTEHPPDVGAGTEFKYVIMSGSKAPSALGLLRV